MIQLDIVNAYPSADRQAQFNVPAGRAAKSYGNGHVHMGDDIPCPASLRHYWSYFESLQGTASTLHFSDYQGQAHKIVCSKGGQQGDAFETVRFALLLLLSLNRHSSRILISTSMCPSSIAFFWVIESTTTIMHLLFFKMLCRPILSSHVVGHGCRHLHDGAACRRGTHWQ